jgi:hypothetical protein
VFGLTAPGRTRAHAFGLLDAADRRRGRSAVLALAGFCLVFAGCSAKTGAAPTAGADAGLSGRRAAGTGAASVSSAGGAAPSGAGAGSGGAGSSAAGSHATGGAGASGAAGGGAGAGGAGAATAAGSGAADAGSTGAAGGGGHASGARGCQAAGLVFCDDFELGTTAGMAPPAPKWSLALNGDGSVAIDDAVAAHSGSKSVHVSSRGGYQTFFALSGAPIFPAAGALYLRLYIRLGAAMSSGHNTYYKAGAAGAPSSDHETRVGVMNAMLMINQPASDRGFLSNQNYYNDGNKPGVVFAPMVWTCVEQLFDPAHSTFDIWVDGKEVPDLHRNDWQQDALGSFHFGFEKYAGPDADIWYDDIAVSTQPIGCE